MFLAVAEEDQWQRLLALMGNPEWSTWEIFQGVMNRTKNQDVLRMYLTEMDERVEGGRSLSRRAGAAHLFCAGFIHVSPRPTGTVARQTLLCRCAPSPCWDAQAPRRTLPAP